MSGFTHIQFSKISGFYPKFWPFSGPLLGHPFDLPKCHDTWWTPEHPEHPNPKHQTKHLNTPRHQKTPQDPRDPKHLNGHKPCFCENVAGPKNTDNIVCPSVFLLFSFCRKTQETMDSVWRRNLQDIFERAPKNGQNFGRKSASKSWKSVDRSKIDEQFGWGRTRISLRGRPKIGQNSLWGETGHLHMCSNMIPLVAMVSFYSSSTGRFGNDGCVEPRTSFLWIGRVSSSFFARHCPVHVQFQLLDRIPSDVSVLHPPDQSGYFSFVEHCQVLASRLPILAFLFPERLFQYCSILPGHTLSGPVFAWIFVSPAPRAVLGFFSVEWTSWNFSTNLTNFCSNRHSNSHRHVCMTSRSMWVDLVTSIYFSGMVNFLPSAHSVEFG